ncbi:MAG: DNA-formamidopyrimidine glycosylase family protein [Planctomycetota bacterium]
MPEGDSIKNAAAKLAPRLEGRTLTDVRTRGDTPLPALIGRTVAAIETHGKHLVLRPEAGPSLRVHLGMYGKWRRFPPGVRWRRSRAAASLILETADDVFACFRGTVEVLRGPLPERAASLVVLGPDLLAEEADLERVVARASLVPSRPIGEVLLDQRVAAGIGNVYKSETLWLGRVAPQRPVGELSAATLEALYACARRLLRANLRPGRRITRGVEPGEAPYRRGGPRTYVYRREGEPCPRCETPVALARQGAANRSCYWCPSCQPASG